MLHRNLLTHTEPPPRPCFKLAPVFFIKNNVPSLKIREGRVGYESRIIPARSRQT